MTLSSACKRGIAFAWILAAVLFPGCARKPQTWTPAPSYGAATGKDFDLTWSKPGANGSPDDPEWAPQAQTPASLPPVKDSPCATSNKPPYNPQCTDQSGKLVQDTGTGLVGLACTLFGDPSAINGHMNWTVASVHGSLDFLNFAEDWDYNLLLLPDGDAGLTGNNNLLGDGPQKYMEVEFDSRELEDRFQTQWWKDFARLAREGAWAGDFTGVDQHLHSGEGYPYGSIYGLFGLDCEHGCRSESHPAFAVAIQVQESKDKNVWAIFARNSGDEGFCSHLDHRLDLGGQPMRVLLPYKSDHAPTAIAIQEAASSQENSQSDASPWCPRFTFSPGEGEVIEIPLPAPDARGLTEVVVQFTWPEGAAPMPSKKLDRKMAAQMMAEARSTGTPGKTRQASAEERLDQLYRLVSPEKRSLPAAQFRPNVLASYANVHPAAKALIQASVFAKPNAELKCALPETSRLTAQIPEKVALPKVKRQTLPSHLEKDMWDKASIASLCSAYQKFKDAGNKLPDSEPPDTAAKLERLCSDKRLKN